MSKRLPRADHVGSLLRPPAVREARERVGAAQVDRHGFATNPTLTAVENDAINDLIAMQEGIGLEVVTDGEVRRSFWHYDFMGALHGLDLVERGEGVAFQGKNLRPIYPTISERLAFPKNHPMLAHFEYLNSHTRVTPKISIPGPSACHFRTAADDIAPIEYQDLDVLFADLEQVYRDATREFYDRGCRFLQMDDIFFAYLCDPKHREQKHDAGIDPDWLIEKYAQTMNRAIADRPDDLIIGMHMCRGNFQSTWAADGAYDPVADTIFNHIDVDLYFMEYDSDRAGGLEPLRLLPKGDKRVLAGFITTKSPEIESIDDLRRRFDEASRYVDLDQLGIAPQCGFASTEEGNLLSVDDQKRKLELVVQTAEAVWGEVLSDTPT